MAHETVLIIEDDSTLLRGLKDNFEFSGYQVKTASDGQAGLEAALTCKPNLILLDIMLPTLNGYEICREVREQKLNMPIIMLTAKGQEEDIVRGLNLGADDYMTKPFSIKELLARAGAFLRRSEATLPEVLEFGDLKLDVSSHKLFKNGEEVVLTPKEFRLLEYLASRTGRALTRDEIMRNVWGSSIVVTSRSVDRCITTLRGKIEPSPRHPTYIQTIRDIGYRFEMPDVEPVVSPQPSGESPDKSRTLARGSRLGRYEIQLVLGRGGMGEVYQARDSKLDRDVAIKVLRKSLAGDPHVLLRFEQEAKAVAALSHPNILAIYDVGKEQHVTYAVTELLKGQSLQDRVERSRLDCKEIVEIGVAVASGLAAAHTSGIIHRDIKPGNIFLSDDGGIKILDFGLARLEKAVRLPSGSDATTMPAEPAAGTIMGTIDYMSPEQIRGQTTDARSDIFSLGCVLYELVSGQRPFSRATAADTLAAILTVDPPELDRAGRKLPPGLNRVVAHCLEKDPEGRFQSARDLAFALGGVGL